MLRVVVFVATAVLGGTRWGGDGRLRACTMRPVSCLLQGLGIQLCGGGAPRGVLPRKSQGFLGVATRYYTRAMGRVRWNARPPLSRAAVFRGQRGLLCTTLALFPGSLPLVCYNGDTAPRPAWPGR